MLCVKIETLMINCNARGPWDKLQQRAERAESYASSHGHPEGRQGVGAFAPLPLSPSPLFDA